MKVAIIFLSLFIGTNCSYLGSDCHLNETKPDLVFQECKKIEVTDFTTSCSIFNSNSCETNPCFSEPLLLPTSFPCPEHYVCLWSKKSDQGLSINAKIGIGIAILVFLLLAIGIIIFVFRWKRVCLQMTTSSNLRFYAVLHSNSDESTVHCPNDDEINSENTP